MNIVNKQAYGIYKLNSDLEYEIYEEYEKDILRRLMKLNKNIHVICEYKKSLYFSTNNYNYYSINDNGGEFNIIKLNTDICLSIPYTSNRSMCNANTMAYRIYVALRDDSLNLIDWNKVC